MAGTEAARFDAVVRRFDGGGGVGPLDLAVPRGRTVALIGPSGCGKTTVLRLLNGLAQPDAGTVHVLGEALTPARLRSVRHRMGYVIQDGGLFPHLSARDNVALLSRHLGKPAAEVDARITTLAALARLPGALLDRHPAELSGGQRQRVALVRALMLEPELLLLDEPLGALDPMVRAELSEDLAAIFRRLGTTVILVTHDLGEAAYFADDLVLFDAGRVVQRGSHDELARRPVEPFVERFLSAQRRAPRETS